MEVATPEAYRLMHEGAVTLAAVEAAGWRVDVAYLDKMRKTAEQKINTLTKRMQASDVWQAWQQRYGTKASFGSRMQLGVILFDVMGLPCEKRTKSGRPSTDEADLEAVDHPFCKDYLRLEKLKKLRSTYLNGLLREVEGEYVHPFYNLHLVTSFRSSCSDPNAQNIPARNQELSKVIRRAFIPRQGHVLVEVDYKSVEVRISAAYHKDPTMLEYIETGYDLHADMAKECFLLDAEQVTKQARYVSKNGFVFPSFYGDYYVGIARSMWRSITRGGLKTVDGATLQSHLRQKGIKNHAEFEAHIRQVEERFWGQRFPQYDQWRRDWYAKYKQRGWFRLDTGFICQGIYRRNEVVNLPVQGCLAATSKVLTDKGWIPIEDLVGKLTRVWTGFSWADAFGVNMGPARLARIHLTSGLIVSCDDRHKFKNEFGEWVPFKKMAKGMYVSLPRTAKEIKYSGEVDWPFVFGFIVGDGHLGLRIRNGLLRKYVTICGGEKKRKEILAIREFLISKGYKVGYGEVAPTENRKEVRYRIRIEKKRFVQFLEAAGFVFGSTAHTKRLPSVVWGWGIQAQRDFMEGLWRSDGGRHEWQLGYLHMCNPDLLREVQILVAPLGFDSWLCQTSSGYLLRVSRRKFNGKSHRLYPKAAIDRFVSRISRSNYESHCDYITDLRVFKRKPVATQYTAERIIDRNGIRGSEVYRFDQIERVELLDAVESTYTMSVDDPLHQFVADGVLHKNSAFHCLLWSLIRLHRWLRKHRMQSLIVGQIHDSIVLDVKREELQDVVAAARTIMCELIRKQWPWIITPLEVEVEVGERNWYEKKQEEL